MLLGILQSGIETCGCSGHFRLLQGGHRNILTLPCAICRRVHNSGWFLRGLFYGLPKNCEGIDLETAHEGLGCLRRAPETFPESCLGLHREAFEVCLYLEVVVIHKCSRGRCGFCRARRAESIAVRLDKSQSKSCINLDSVISAHCEGVLLSLFRLVDSHQSSDVKHFQMT